MLAWFRSKYVLPCGMLGQATSTGCRPEGLHDGTRVCILGCVQLNSVQPVLMLVWVCDTCREADPVEPTGDSDPSGEYQEGDQEPCIYCCTGWCIVEEIS